MLRSSKPVVFLVGSALTAPLKPDGLGVPGVSGVIDLILNEFNGDQAKELQNKLKDSTNEYQDAFHFLLGRRGPHAANSIIRSAMSRARLPTAAYQLTAATEESVCRSFDRDHSGWFLSPGVTALGELIASHSTRFGETVLTTNFDPLVEVAIRVAGGAAYRTVLHSDGNLDQTSADGTHVVHLHGYWYGSDTLHTPRQLGQARPQLKASLSQLIRNKTVVVMAYGGWDDAFTAALVDVVLDDSAYPEVVWAFHGERPLLRESLARGLEAGIARSRVMLYGGIDCHTFLPDLVAWWEAKEPSPLRAAAPPKAIQIIPTSAPDARTTSKPRLSFDEVQRPPNIDYYVGRKDDLETLSTSTFTVGFVTGMGGQGKSSLAATYMSTPTTATRFPDRLWRDCKEEGERFEDHIIRIVQSLTEGAASSGELASQSIEDLADLFIELSIKSPILVVFDNIDHYIDLERNTLIGSVDRFASRILNRECRSQVVFTCRPPVQWSHPDALCHHLRGLDREAAHELFRLRRAPASEADIDRAHQLTGGHAFWLDILAAQVAKHHQIRSLSDLLQSMPSGGVELPDETLDSIWKNLPDREKIVLQALAETLRPTTEIELSDYLGSRLRYNQMSRAVRSLRDINLIVSRPIGFTRDGLELHPLIRAFIRKTFPIKERISFIKSILQVYGAFFGAHRWQSGSRPSPTAIAQWLEGAELSISAGLENSAISLLAEVEPIIRRDEPPGEFIRICKQIFIYDNYKRLAKIKGFEKVFETFVRCLANHSRLAEAMEALEGYHDTLTGKEARYIHYCDMRCYLYWISENYPAAIRWGAEGAKLKSKSGVDTQYTTEHNLALAQRDSGAVDQALAHFIKGSTIEDAIDPEKIDLDRGGPFYGNVGRCLQLMGQIDNALACFRKSARLIEEQAEDHTENQAYIRQWIGEVLLRCKDYYHANLFLCASAAKWAVVAPSRAKRIQTFLEQEIGDREPRVAPTVAERACQDWILG